MKLLLLVPIFLIGIFSQAQTFTLRSLDLGGQATMKQVFNGFGCSGSNVSPQLHWENAPAGTKSFAVTMYDEDAPTGSGWWHWIIFDIDQHTTALKAGAGDVSKNNAPRNSVQSQTDFGVPGYGGPCPPPGSGIHRYVITVYALKKEKLGLEATATPALVGFTLSQNTLEKASLLFYYKQ